MDARAARRHPAPMSAGIMGEDFEAARLTVRLGAIAANYRTYCRMTGPCAVAAVVVVPVTSFTQTLWPSSMSSFAKATSMRICSPMRPWWPVRP